MGKFIDISGNRFGYLTVIDMGEPKISKSGNKRIMWDCLCDCGNKTIVYGGHLKSGHTKSCGKCGKFSNFKDLTGQKFDELIVLKFDSWYYYPNGERDARWLCKCDCGNLITIRGNSLKSKDFGHSCGCYNKRYRIDDLEMIGKSFGSLVVLKRLPSLMFENESSKDMWLCKCNCGNMIEARGSYLRYGKINSCGCLYKNSGYERILASYLKKHNVEFASQKSFSDCASDNNRPLFFDFYIKTNSKNVLIELNGVQHYKSIDYFGGDEDFIKRKRRDFLKMEYANKKNIPLIIIDCTNLKHAKVIDKVRHKLKNINIVI